MQRVLVIGKNKEPLMPCHPARARELLKKGKAAVYRKYPFTIILKGRAGGGTQEVQAKVDPGSRTTGIALVADCKRGEKVVWAAELTHKGEQVKKELLKRRQLRSSRRSRKTRYRPARFNNSARPDGWLPPSLMSRVQNVETWVKRLQKVVPVTSLSLELVRFDAQKMMNAEVSGVKYQQGELQGYEVREYLLEKWGRCCIYCGVTDTPLEVEHILPKARGGGDRVSNLTIACTECNQAKGSRLVQDFLAHDPKKLEVILKQAKQPLKDAAAVNATRWKLLETLKAFGLPLETGSGARTKFNRSTQHYPKTHWIDAAMTGKSGEEVHLEPTHKPLLIKALGRGNRQMCGTDKFGFPIRHRQRKKVFEYEGKTFRTGDVVIAVIPKGKYKGVHKGRVTCRSRPSYKVNGVDVHPKRLQVLQRSDGYAYA